MRVEINYEHAYCNTIPYCTIKMDVCGVFYMDYIDDVEPQDD